ncbi:antimicrobial peptide NK-lysin [Larimichthys crocea]|uniref:NK-lysin-like type 3 protein n=1 Tax=Larimichthys crocea TaxID=215358 RepID=A0A0U2IHG1_LARCR|nr:antimicrobial peptide NK-lysin [Larimichthys crocea]ALH22548.1 NK-lysin-like type 3 protein [Larimichthys crocea]
MTMSPAISIALLLLSAVVVKSWESPEDETEEEEDDSSAELNHDMKERADHDAEEILQDQAFPGSCYACRYIVSKVKRQAGRDHSKARIRCLMMGVCNGFRSRFVRSACKKVTRRYQYRLSNYIAKNGSSRRICARLRLCRRVSQ